MKNDQGLVFDYIDARVKIKLTKLHFTIVIVLSIWRRMSRKILVQYSKYKKVLTKTSLL